LNSITNANSIAFGLVNPKELGKSCYLDLKSRKAKSTMAQKLSTIPKYEFLPLITKIQNNEDKLQF
jgi:hypothetical protein